MATSDFQTEKRPILKRCLEKDLNISNKRFKSGEETELFCEIQSKKVVRVVGRGGRNWKSSYQRYRSSYYGSRKESNIVKSRIGNKRREVNGMKENFENVVSSDDIKNSENIKVSEITEDVENIDSVNIEELVVWQPTSGSDAFNEGFEVSDLNKIEAFVEEDGDVVEQFWEAMKSVKLLSVKLDSLIMKMRKYQFETMKIFKSMKL